MFFSILIFCFGALGLLYLVFLGNMVKNIVERKTLNIRERALSAEVRKLELNYLALSNNIDLNFSHSLGFKETKATFVTRKSLGFQNTTSPKVSATVAQNGI